MNEQIKLGMEVRDKISGLTGIVTSVTEFLYGCRRLGVSPKEVKDGLIVDSSMVDEPQLEVVGDGIREDAMQEKPIKEERNYGDPGFKAIKHNLRL